MKRILLSIILAGLFAGMAAAQVPTTGTITATSAACTPTSCVLAPVARTNSTAVVQVTGAFGATLEFETSLDSTTFVAISGANAAGSSTSTIAPGIWQFSVAGYLWIRVRASAYATGAAVVSIMLSDAIPTGVAGGMATLSAPADGATFTPGSGDALPVAGFYHATRDTVADGKTAVFAINENRAVITQLEDVLKNGITSTSDGGSKRGLDIYVAGGSVVDAPDDATPTSDPVPVACFNRNAGSIAAGHSGFIRCNDNGESIPAAETQIRHISDGMAGEDEFAVCTGPCVFASIEATNFHATAAAFLKCTNLTVANTTPGMSAVVWSLELAPAGGGFIGKPNRTFSVAMTCYIVLGKADSDVAEVGADDVHVNLGVR